MSVSTHSPEPTQNAQHKVLVVEDDPGDARLIEHLLRPQHAFSLDHVATLSGTRARLLRERYDAILLDLTLPDGKQQDTLRELARFAEHVPIVALTGLEDDSFAETCLEMGIQDYVFKSDLTDTSLVRSLNHAISRHRAKELQRRIESAERQISLGRVAGGVVHEVNNLATVVLSNLEHARQRLETLRVSVHAELRGDVAELVTCFEENIGAMSRMTAMASELQLFAQREESSGEVADVNSIVSRTLRLLDGRLRLRAEVHSILGEPSLVRAHESKLGQVLINLLLNAADAIDEATTLERRIDIETKCEPPWVSLSVSDTGCGIPQDLLQHVFEPFFSSKPLGKGSGLGLSICSELVSSWGGTIRVESQPGQGSRFTIQLPLANSDQGAATSLAPTETPASQHARVLLVDDLDAPRRALRRLMHRHHDVVEASSGMEALELLRNPPRFDVVLCDLMMPEMDGMELYSQAILIDPTLEGRFILLTGGAFTERAQSALERSELPVLSKPITRTALLGAIASVLAARLTEL